MNSIMADSAGIKLSTNSSLFRLLRIKQENAGITVKGLNKAIQETKAVMSQEEVAYVEKLVVELEDD
ncbi:MAG: hypothetical protein FWG83_00590 [Oscillospiraceae bacterium]|nr:hypothetical protein [Oscillospiraceae bacterium]